ncbi:signal transduction histidine kinase [Curtobacterium sp. PhB25]|uniref:sensor histidine kinase n=1 Tax=Curtobacterium sp. PhB25 TaxID=2485205 RepID=UPI001066464A|nr:histidine kinase [Curtobacterium sp. PhB25]TDW63513.1 signal transduction histidine kinase [Curtobacterium sp. PhB25]
MEWTVYTVGVTLLTLFDILTSAAVWQWLSFVVVAVLGTLALRGRFPAWALGLVSLVVTATFLTVGDATGAAGTFGLGECFVLLIVIIVRSRKAAGPRGWAGVALVVGALVCVPVRVLSPDVLVFVIVLVAGAGCALAAGAVLRNMDGERRLALAIATQHERDELARDLHDDFTNRVTSMILMVQAARRSLGSPSADLDDDLAKVEAAGSEALGSMRRWVATLRASDVERNHELGTTPLAEIPLILEQWEATSPTGHARYIDETSSAVPEEIQTTTYRIVQEAVTNASRHAPDARWLEVSIADHDGTLVVQVLNPVTSTPAVDSVPGSAGLGITGMQERARLLGGTVEAGPVGSSTWSVRAVIPLDGAA